MNTTSTSVSIDLKNSGTFSKLYGKYVGLLQFIARKSNVPQCEGEELIQECFLRLFDSDAQFISEEAVKGFLAVSLKRQIIDRSRRMHVRKTESYEIACPHGAQTTLWESDCELELEVAKISEAIDRISAVPGDELFGWFYRDGLSAKDIAQKAGIAVGSVTSKLCRLRTKNRDLIMSYLECTAGTPAFAVDQRRA